MFQFLFEAIILCLIGGAIGLLIVWLLAMLLTNILDFEFVLSFSNVLIGTSLSGGGANKNQALISKMFHQHGFETHNVIVVNSISFDYGGELFNLGLHKSNGILNRIKRFYLLRNYIKNHKFDFIIDFRDRSKVLQEFFVLNFIYTVPYIPTIRSFYLEYYLL